MTPLVVDGVARTELPLGVASLVGSARSGHYALVTLAWGEVLGGALIGGLTIWGFIAPAMPLRRSRNLRLWPLLASYGRHVRLIPRAVWLTFRGARKNPWTAHGPQVVWAFLVALAFVGALREVLLSVAGPDRTESLVWMPVLLAVGLGWGMGLVRDTQGCEDGLDERSEPPPGAHFE